MAGEAGTSTFTWTNLTERFDAQVEAGSLAHSGASDAFAAAATPTITATPSAANAEAFIAASWGPA